MKKLSDADFISCNTSYTLYQTPHTSVSSDKMTLQYVCSEQLGRIVFHRKLRVYKSESGFYVIARGTRCYVNDLMHKWFYK
jgi:hypothetical protein